ncbi:MAG TPA: DUF6785 family protein [Planctomycetota bacterium]|nr:DUF6785 family protein [Planctomycetota bacterium]
MGSIEQKDFIPGITFRSVCASLFAMLLMGMHIQLVEIILHDGSAEAEQSLPISAMIVFVGFAVACGLLRWVSKHALLTRQELLCVFFAMLISAPMMTQGMWHRFIGLISSPPRTASFSYLDAYSDKLWPHGPNLVEGGLDESNKAALTERGNPPEWAEVEYKEGRSARLPVLRNSRPDEVSSITLTIPLRANTMVRPYGRGADGKPHARRGERHLISCLVRPEGLSTQSFYFIRVYADDDPNSEEVVNAREPGAKTFIQRAGFLRIGHYGTVLPPAASECVRLEIGLSGVGSAAFYDPKLINVAALEGVYKGRAIIRQSEYDKLPPGQCADLIVKPDSMWSPAGLKFLVTGYIPVGDWLNTAVAWSAPIVLLLMGTLAINVLLRRQWAESERYAFPLFQIPRAIMGSEDEPGAAPFAAVWRNRYLWAGFALAVAWGLMKGWHFYNPKVPDTSIKVSLNQYLTDPNWGAMWQTEFTVSALFLSIAMFFELNVLGSIVIGFLAYRALFWVGETTGVKMYRGYPWRYEQAIGAYLGYAAVVVFLARKYLRGVLAAALKNDRSAWQGEALGYRWALLMLLLVFVGFAAWAAWLHVSIVAILIFFAFLLSIGLVASKLRAECGLPNGYFTPYNAMLFIALIGGMGLFGADGLLLCSIMSGFLTVSVFFFIPGAQMELLEYGRRYRVVPRHLVVTAVIGALGGLFIGGWVFLSNSYSIGGENIGYQWSYNQDWFYWTYKIQLATADSQLASGQASAGGLEPSTWAYVYGGSITVVLAVLRQVFSGFWFHPIGFILGSSHMLEWVWGSVLAAWAIRFVVLKLGGAATVRNKLMPFCVGMFLGVLAVAIFFNVIAVILRSQGVERIYGVLT